MYKIKHIPTGLYYEGYKFTTGNLSLYNNEGGDIFTKHPTDEWITENLQVISVVCEDNEFNTFRKSLIESISNSPSTIDYFGNHVFTLKVSLSDWKVEEIITDVKKYNKKLYNDIKKLDNDTNFTEKLLSKGLTIDLEIIKESPIAFISDIVELLIAEK